MPGETTDSEEKLIKFFDNLFPLNSEERQEVYTHFNERRIKRRGFILQHGDVCKHFTFVVSGCLKMYVIDLAGKEHNLQFVTENDWVSDLTSFYQEIPSNVYIEAIEPAVILQVKHDDLLSLYTRYHKFDRNFRIILERKYIQLQSRTLQNISVSAEERYRHFIEHHPSLASRLPNTQIASYLGITPEFLSKIRKELVKK
ncbi:cAMP-binding domain of CRP or a regulatory subunit of cAMP-dependent protein kinases [Pedobacter westerhofensis]|uniref:cAMP-binding domain of CRP or a regulatory subunit of cAMP-dependent protein kinases n=1 Tax=Pedobacter westerhofensis TaxID=425512 RepID=A0A521FL59_9SPHI|nr:Crp/Fnr family transcriptional regulator [Pedobacter westerhofensis]SMO96905.1 cAMP-binding domain of CRP or a regulatory subunit of cAMP-dependent protein kinases [Pedobacter westerhofensis]